jgi:hypothetical protein
MGRWHAGEENSPAQRDNPKEEVRLQRGDVSGIKTNPITQLHLLQLTLPDGGPTIRSDLRDHSAANPC